MLDYTAYPSTIADANYTYNKAKDASGATALDGTPLLASFMNDILGSWQALIKTGSVTPSGSSDNENTSDILDAIQASAKLAAWPVGSTYIQFPGDSDPAAAGLLGTWANVSSELAGDFIRFEGGNASAFESGQQSDAMQRITGSTGDGGIRAEDSPLWTGDGVLSRTNPSIAQSGDNTFSSYPIYFDNADSISPNAAKTDDVETRAVNRTVRKWRRTA